MSKDEMDESIGVIALCILGSLVAVTLVNLYSGSRAEEGWRDGYIAGYAEAVAKLPSRLEYKEYKPKPSQQN